MAGEGCASRASTSAGGSGPGSVQGVLESAFELAGFQAAQKKCPIHVRNPCICNEVAIQASAELVVACQAGAASTAEGSEKNDGEEPDSPDDTQGFDVSQADPEAEPQELRQKRRKVKGP